MEDDDYTTNSHYITYTFVFKKVGRMYFLNSFTSGPNLGGARPRPQPVAAQTRRALKEQSSLRALNQQPAVRANPEKPRETGNQHHNNEEEGSVLPTQRVPLPLGRQVQTQKGVHHRVADGRPQSQDTNGGHLRERIFPIAVRFPTLRMEDIIRIWTVETN